MELPKRDRKYSIDDNNNTNSSSSSFNASCLDPLGVGSWIHNKYRTRKFKKNIVHGKVAIEGLKIKRNELNSNLEICQKKHEKIIEDIKNAMRKKQRGACLKLLKEKKIIENDIISFQRTINTYDTQLIKTLNNLRELETNENLKVYARGISKISFNGFFDEVDSTIRKLDDHSLDMDDVSEKIGQLHEQNIFGEVNINDSVEEEYENMLREMMEEEDERIIKSYTEMEVPGKMEVKYSAPTKVPNRKGAHEKVALLTSQ